MFLQEGGDRFLDQKQKIAFWLEALLGCLVAFGEFSRQAPFFCRK
jgi:hypothetical protein